MREEEREEKGEEMERKQSRREEGWRGGGGHIVMELLAELLAVHGYSCSWWLQLNGANREAETEGEGGMGAEFQPNKKSAHALSTEHHANTHRPVKR